MGKEVLRPVGPYSAKRISFNLQSIIFFNFDLRSSLLTLGRIGASFILPSLNRSLQSSI